MCKNVCGAGKLLRILVVELYGIVLYTVDIVVNDKSLF